MGFDNECILNIQSLAGEYFCPVCRTLVYPNEALQSQCTHLYCKPCLSYIATSTQACPYDGYLVTEAGSKPLVESNKALAETIGKIAVHCLYHRSGCTWQGPLSECTTHCSGCAFGNSPVVCNRCGVQIVHRQVQEHAQTCSVNGATQAHQGAENVQEPVTSSAAAVTDQSKSATQPGVPASSQASQTVAAPSSGLNPNQQAIANPQSQVVPVIGGPSQEQWYQQQYQQFYQQYPGYDPYQAYQQYYPYQQQATQQFQQQPPQVQSQPQLHLQPQSQAQQQQVQPPIQSQPQLQVQPQAQPLSHPQPQPQIPTHGQPQPHLYPQAAVAAQNQHQVQINQPQQTHAAVQPHAQVPSQSQPPPHGHLPPQSYPQVQTLPQQQMQPQYQQSNSQMHHTYPPSQPQPQSQLHPQGHPQAQFQPPQPHPQLHPPQPNPLPTPNAQPHSQHPPVQSVTGHPSYTQPQPHQQMQQGPPHHLMQIPPSGGSLPPTQAPGQFAQQPPAHLRPPQAHAFLPNQQQPALLPSQGQVSSIPPVQQQFHPYNQQPGLPVHQRPVMQPTQQPVMQQYGQHPQAFAGQVSGPVQSQLHHPAHFVQHPSQLRPQGPPQAMQQQPVPYVQPQQSVALGHGMQPQQPQNYAGRPVLPNHGVQSQHLPPSSGALGVAPQPRPPQFGSSQLSMNQNHVNTINNPLQSSSEQQFFQSGLPVNATVSERKGEQIAGRSVELQGAELLSQKKAEKDANGLGADSVEVKSETALKSMNDEHKPIDEGEDSYRRDEDVAKNGVSDAYPMKEVSRDPALIKRLKEEGTDSTLERSPGGKAASTKSLEEGDEKNAVNMNAQASTEADKGSLGLPSNSLAPPGSNSYNDRNLNQSHSTPQGPRGDETGGFQGKAFEQSSQSVPSTDQGRHQLPPPIPYGPSGHQQRSAVPSTSIPAPPGGYPSNAQVPGHPPTLSRPLGPGHLSHPGQVLNVSEHFQPSVQKQSGSLHPDIPLSGVHGPGTPTSYGRGPNHVGNSQRSFQLQSAAPQGPYNQGNIPSALSRISQGEPVGPLIGAVPPGSFDPHEGIIGRAPAPRVPEGPIGQHFPINPMEGEMFSNHRPSNFDGRRPDSHVPGSLDRGSFGQSFGSDSNPMRMNGPPSLDSSSALAPRDERYKTLAEGRSDTLPMGQARRVDQSELQDGYKQFPRPSHLGNEASPKFGNNFSSRPIDRGGFGMDGPSRLIDKGPHGFNYDAGQKVDVGASSGFLPPYHPGAALHPNDSGGRALPVGIHSDHRGGPDPSRTNPDFLGPAPGFGRHHMDRLPPRSPGREYLGNSSHPFGGLSGVPRGIDDIDGREKRPFGEGSRSFNIGSDSVGRSIHESKFPILPPGHLRRGELDGPGNSRMGEHLRSGDLIGQDVMPSHLRRGEFLGPRNLSGHPRLGDTGFGSFPGLGRVGDSGGSGGFSHQHPFGESFGNRLSHPRLGEPGFRSSYSLQGFPNDGGFYAGDSDFERPHKRKQASTGWCRICKIDCESVEGLDMHSQTRQHQKMAMDMVISIKDKNAKKPRTSNHPMREEPSKSRKAAFQGRGKKP